MTRSKKFRNLSESERLLWAEVVKKAKPLNVLRDNPEVKHKARKTAGISQVSPSDRLFHLGSGPPLPRVQVLLQPDLDTRLSNVSPNMDRRNFDRLKKGKLKVEGRIDLHGLTQAEAHPALMAYIRQSHDSGKRLVLVITGKGKMPRGDQLMPQRRGILKHAVPEWLHQPEMAPRVLQVTQAHAKHGGSGAYYVYLRRRR